MLLTTYTTFAQIRSVLGVNEEEITDIDMGQQILADTVEERLLDIGSTVLTRYDEILLLPSATSTELRYVKLVNMLIAYLAAREILAASTMFFPQSIEDGRAKQTRFAMTPEYGDNVRAMCSDLRAKLVATLNTLYPGEVVVADTSIRLMSTAGLATDPVIQ